MTLYVGTSGWAYREWKPDFYPADLKQKEFLTHYASQLGACEINATFYRLQKNETFERWAEAVPDRFRFAIKAHRRLTHGKTIAPDEQQIEFLQAFLRSLKPLEAHLGSLLFQFPPYRKCDLDALRLLMDHIPVERCAFEFRDPSWTTQQVQDEIVQRGGAVCFADTTGETPTELLGGGLAYVRMRHDHYTDEQRESWRRALAGIGDRNVFVFTKHEGVAAGDPHAGVGLAVWLQEMLGADAPADRVSTEYASDGQER
jgi:uncharacterized protein YecE (DUF72 family)